MSLHTKIRARVAALSHGHPARRLKVIVVTGADGSHATVAYLASILQQAKHSVGVITPQYIQMAKRRVEGSEHAKLIGDEFRLQGLLAQMRKAGCEYVLLELGAKLPKHHFAGIPLHMVVVRRCGDVHLSAASRAPQLESLRQLLQAKPHFVVMNRDDVCFEEITGLPAGELTMNFGTHQKAECRITGVKLHPKGSAMQLLVDHQTELQLVTALPGKQAIYSAVAAAAAGYLLHVPVPVIQDGIADLNQLPAHTEYLDTQRPYALVLDSALTPEGMADMLETVKHFTPNRVVAVLSTVAGQPADWRPLIGEIVAKAADRVIVTDGDWQGTESPLTVRDQLLQGVLVAGSEAKTEDIPDRSAALEKALSIARRGDTIVVCSVPLRPYRKHGKTRHPWDDKTLIQELLQG